MMCFVLCFAFLIFHIVRPLVCDLTCAVCPVLLCRYDLICVALSSLRFSLSMIAKSVVDMT